MIGIDVYESFTRLPLARTDAEKFEQWLSSPEGGAVPAGNIFTAFPAERPIRPGLAVPTLREVNDAILQALEAADAAVKSLPDAWDRTRLYIYAAGHGIKPRRGRGALLMANATKQLLGYNVDFKTYAKWFRKNGTFRDILIFADCCRVSPALASAYEPPFSIPTTGRSGRSFVVYATSPGEAATADAAGGLFTRALLGALDIGAGRTEKTVTTETLRNALCDAMSGTAAFGGSGQTPDFESKGADQMVIRSARSASPAKVVLRFGTAFRGVGVIANRFLEEQARVPVSGTEATIELPPGLYEFTVHDRSDLTFRNDGLFRIDFQEGTHYVDL